MALFPCDFCGGRYTGRQSTVYPALTRRAAALREKRRLCPPCLSRLEDFLDEHGLPADSDGTPTLCLLCGAGFADAFFFVTLYAAGRERQDFYGVSCKNCIDHELGTALFGPVLPLEAPEGLWGYLESHTA